jgi:hypothetical protein
MSDRLELIKQFNSEQSKLTYYIIALSVAAIGFSISKTIDQQLELHLIVLGASVLSWGLSIYCGFSFIKYRLSTNFANIEYFNIIEGKNSEVGSHPDKIKAATEGIKSAMDTNSKRAGRFSKWHSQLFYVGIILFIVWHIINMITST